MSCLAPCPTCNRHVATDENTCPFCSAALPDSLRCQPPRQPRGRVSRAGLLVAGAALIGVGQACASPVYGSPPPHDAGADTSTIDGSSDSSAVALYGAAPASLEQAPADNPPTPPAKSKT